MIKENQASELHIHSPHANMIACLIKQGLPTLWQIRGALEGEVSYNQIRVVLGSMITDELDRIII